MRPLLERSYDQARQTTARWAKSFHFASWFLPAGKRRAIFALYDYCRHADNLVDERGDRTPDDVRAQLADLRHTVIRLHGGQQPDDSRWLALWDTLRRFPVPLEPMLDLLDGVAMDLEPVDMGDFSELHEYCRLVAGGVGLMIGPILGAGGGAFRERGVGLGIAMQLTNVLRDIREDTAAGRCYLPRAELARFGLSRDELERGVATPAFQEMMAFQVARARAYFDSADVVVPMFPDDGSRICVRLMQRTYAAILDRIERLEYDVFRERAYVPLGGKLLILGRVLRRERRRPRAEPRMMPRFRVPLREEETG